MVKHQKLDDNIYNSLTKISSLEIVYLVMKKLAIFKQVKKHVKNLVVFSLNVISDFY